MRRAKRTERMTTFVAAHYQRPIRVADVAAAAGLHPNDASVLFRKMTGQSVVKHVTQYRVAHAQRLLITGALSILKIMLRRRIQVERPLSLSLRSGLRRLAQTVSAQERSVS